MWQYCILATHFQVNISWPKCTFVTIKKHVYENPLSRVILSTTTLYQTAYMWVGQSLLTNELTMYFLNYYPRHGNRRYGNIIAITVLGSMHVINNYVAGNLWRYFGKLYSPIQFFHCAGILKETVVCLWGENIESLRSTSYQATHRNLLKALSLEAYAGVAKGSQSCAITKLNK